MGDPKRLQVSARNDLSELGRVTEEIHAFLAPHVIGPQVLYALDVVLEELLSNSIKYSFNDGRPHEILVSVAVSAASVDLTLEDDGREFDPFQVPAPDTGQPPEARPVGGLGIHLVRRMAENVQYQRRGAKNVLTVALKR